ncbi:MAG: DUF308 domain-containing protein [Saprospiraceae bacterium]|nr:DUF308 domain-containing protein [Saprospiraceae bacterium]
MMLKRVFLIILSVVYIGVGLLVVFRPVLAMPIYNYSLATLFLIYGIWRLYRSLRTIE